MVTEAAVKMASVSFEEGFDKDIDMLLREQQHHSHLHHEQSRAPFDRERDLNVYRSGSAPPTVEGSRNAIGSLFGRSEVGWLDGQNFIDELSEEKMRSQLSYTSYYYSNENLNPRLPPPIMSKEDWRVVQRFRFGGSGLEGLDDPSRVQAVESDESSRSLFSMQPNLSVQEENESMERSGEWLERGRDGLIGLPEIGLGSRRKSFADVLQEDLSNSSSKITGNASRPPSRNAFDHSVVAGHLTQLHNDVVNFDTIRSGRTSPGLSRVQSMGSKASQSFLSAVDPSLPRSRTPDPLMIGKSSSPGLTAVGSRAFDVDSKKMATSAVDYDVAAALVGLKLSSKTGIAGNAAQNQFQHESDCYNASMNGFLSNEFSSARVSKEQNNFQKCLPDNLYKKSSFGGKFNIAGSSGYQLDSLNSNFSENNSNTYLHNLGLPSILTNHLDAVAANATGTEYIDMHAGQEGSGYPTSAIDPLYSQYLQAATGYNFPYLGNFNESSLSGNFLGSSLMDLTPYQKAYIETMLAQQKGGSLSKAGSLSNGFYGASGLGLGLGMPYPSSSLSSISSLSHGGGLRQHDRMSRLPSMLRSGMGLPKGSWSYENGIMEENYASTLLEDFKNNKTRPFELSDILDNVVEFSADQYGSRFIQQKLESASVDEKNKIFPEILPHARALMTDVFGNYVIQKFFEHGTESQRNQLASQVSGHVLPLSLQMYGCRVIQKALEVVGMEQQATMVSELDGSVMKCVRDQNGNHVIQKCIECVPQERIQFIISSFYGQVVSLSTHPYGCRVIQRVLEHCNDLQTQSIMMDEILLSVCSLAEDQYGNYVVQHVLQHGKPTERSAIITKLSGQIVKMSQQKFASNVIEKCLTYGKPLERLLLIKEMLGPNEENEPLQAMMKDQFGNYVVQKVLETCDDQNRELILSRIKVHLSALKKYTYGKHIVARVEKLIAAGERRMGMTLST